ncbi:hypothetical protein COCON_G00120330 [Conger conger]|uniref:Uncharacterized protein n=1 Tax=Conger conger TaxID=82655 RepID=A0A9Q1HYK6_CONCO|nr:hypothetical protein COCON_G00120330 [Conger conger]
MRGADFTIALLKALPSLFPSPTPPPKRLGGASEALIHVLERNEDPNKYLEKHPLSSPVLLYDGSACILSIGNYPVSPLEEVFNDISISKAKQPRLQFFPRTLQGDSRRNFKDILYHTNKWLEHMQSQEERDPGPVPA